MDPLIIALVGMSEDDEVLFVENEVTTQEDLSMLSSLDIKSIIPDAQVLVARKLCTVAKYLRLGREIDGTTTMLQINQHVHGGGGGAEGFNQSDISDIAKGAPKIRVNSIKEFSGDPVDWDDWEKATRATLGQTIYSSLLEAGPTAGDLYMESRNKEFYNMLWAAVQGKQAEHILLSLGPGVVDGHAGWQALKAWYGTTEVSRTVVEYHRNKINALFLDENTTATEFINTYILSSQKLEEKNEGVTPETKMETFLSKILDPDYDHQKQTYQNKQVKTFAEIVEAVRRREQTLLVQDGHNSKKKSRRLNNGSRSATGGGRNGGSSKGGNSGGGKADGKIPLIPYFIVNAIKPKEARSALLMWRTKWNNEQREVKPEETELQDGDGGTATEGQGTAGKISSGSNTSHNTKGGSSKAVRQKSRRSVVAQVGSRAGSSCAQVQFLWKEREGQPHGDEDSESEGQAGSEKGGEESPAVSSVQKRARRNPVTRRGRTTNEQPKGIIDPGTDFEIIGGVGWKVLEHLNRNTQMDGALAGMAGETLPVVTAVTAFDHKDHGPVLLGLGAAAWDSRIEQTESLLNSHELRKNHVVVEDTSKRDGGLQCIIVDDIQIDLSFEAGRILYIPLREPTDKELGDLDIHWLTPRTASSDVKLLVRRNIMATVPDPASWEERLGNCPLTVAEKTLGATTQLCSDPIEMENREAPHQHRKQRLLPLHPRRVTGRTDSDTFFSSVKSVRGFTCVQLFVCIASQYLFTQCMRREAHSHGALQDFIRKIGAPNLLLTDNAQTQIGTKWTTTSRAYAIKQVFTVPHNQQQNQAERKVQDLKRRVILTLRYSKAPLEFWCYCLEFVVDCFNHSAHQQLNWRTPMEFMHGHTPDISMFRFRFWEPVWYYEPTAKYPKPNFLPGRFVGIAWDHGDSLTYRIWTTPDGDASKGRELIRNVVRGRCLEMADPQVLYGEDALEFFLSKGNQRKRKRGSGSAETGDLVVIDPTPCEIPTSDVGDEVSATVQPAPAESTEGMTAEEPGGVEVVDNAESRSEDQVGQEPMGANSEIVDGVVDVHGAIQVTQDDEENVIDMADSTNNPNHPPEEHLDYDPTDIGEVEMTDEVNDFLSGDLRGSEVGGAQVVEINKHSWHNGELCLQVKWDTEEHSWERLKDMKLDHPRLTAQYLVSKYEPRSSRPDRVLPWAKKTLRDISRAVRRVVRLYDFYLDENDEVRKVRRAQLGGSKKKKRQNFSVPVFKYGVQVPRTVRQALELDRQNGNSFWEDAIKKEVGGLDNLQCFKYESSDFKCGADYQKTTLHIIFDVKHDLRRKARLVAGGHLVDALNVDIYSTTVKSISVKLLHVIAHKMGLKQLCGDVESAYVNAYTNEKVYAIAGPEFGVREGQVVIIQKALYGLRSSSERWHAHFADSLRSIGFVPTRYDKDVWIRLGEDKQYYEYVCTHVDDFMVVSKRPELVMQSLKEIYSIKAEGPPEYYLGNDYKMTKGGRWAVGCKKYLTEALARVETMFGPLSKVSVPLPANDHPELETNELLSDDEHRKYQMLLGMLNWIVTIGRFDVAHATASMSRFSSCPRKGHLQRVLRIFGYLKKRSNRRYIVDSRDPEITGGEDDLAKDYCKELGSDYPDASEEVDRSCPKPLVDELVITAFVDSDHAHDQVTRRSITGLLICIGRTPVFYSSKRQGAVETSTYGAEFCAMRTGTEEVIAVRYMLRCLGVKVEHATYLFGDNLGVLQNATIKDSLLKKKHVAISYHRVREAAAAGIIHPVKIDTKDNFADLFTKSLTEKVFARFVGGLTRG